MASPALDFASLRRLLPARSQSHTNGDDRMDVDDGKAPDEARPASVSALEQGVRKVLDAHKDSFREWSVASKAEASEFLAAALRAFPRGHPDERTLSDAMNTFFDYCDDESVDTGVRSVAIKGLGRVAEASRVLLPPVASSLLQLLPAAYELKATDPKEFTALDDTLRRLLRDDAMGVLTGAFEWLIVDKAEPALRKRINAFLEDHFFENADRFLSESESKAFTDKLLKVIDKMDAQVAVGFIEVLPDLKVFDSPRADASLLLDTYAQLAEANLKALTTSRDAIDDVLLTLARTVQGGLGISPRFLTLLAEQLLGRQFSALDQSQRLQLLRLVAEMAPKAKSSEAKVLLPALYRLLVDEGGLLPPAPSGGEGPHLNLTFLELVLYAFHVLGSKAPEVASRVCGMNFAGMAHSSPRVPSVDLQVRAAYARSSVAEYLAQLQTQTPVDPTKASDNGSKPTGKSAHQLDFAKAVCQTVLDLSNALMVEPPKLVSEKEAGAPAFKKFGMASQQQPKSTPVEPKGSGDGWVTLMAPFDRRSRRRERERDRGEHDRRRRRGRDREFGSRSPGPDSKRAKRDRSGSPPRHR